MLFISQVSAKKFSPCLSLTHIHTPSSVVFLSFLHSINTSTRSKRIGLQTCYMSIPLLHTHTPDCEPFAGTDTAPHRGKHLILVGRSRVRSHLFPPIHLLWVDNWNWSDDRTTWRELVKEQRKMDNQGSRGSHFTHCILPHQASRRQEIALKSIYLLLC